jgi:hypothetical protein
MDVTRLTSVIQQQLQGIRGLPSLQLQNHIYGCFIIMEDIAQKSCTVSESQLVGSNVIFDLQHDFATIGLQFGFVMNSKLGLPSVDPAYYEAWSVIFHSLQTIEQVDPIEDAIIEVIQKMVSADDAYFTHALETGSLPEEWLSKVVSLLHPSHEEEDSSMIRHANTEKNLSKKNRLATTRRTKAGSVPKKLLTTTRRKK